MSSERDRYADDLAEAVRAVLAHRIGSLPNRGDLRDNTASRQDIAMMLAALMRYDEQAEYYRE